MLPLGYPLSSPLVTLWLHRHSNTPTYIPLVTLEVTLVPLGGRRVVIIIIINHSYTHRLSPELP